MQIIQKQREMLAQIGAACGEVVRGCEEAQVIEIDIDTLDSLVVALRELLANAEKLRESTMSTRKTEPTHDVFSVCICGHSYADHMPGGFSCCIHCECEGFQS